MEAFSSAAEQKFRLWISTYAAEWQPVHWNDLPPLAVALEAVDGVLYSAAEAGLFVESFNRAMLEGDRRVWAMAIPVTVRYEGDVQPGTRIVGQAFDFSQTSPAP